jgi:hypothetical protein
MKLGLLIVLVSGSLDAIIYRGRDRNHGGPCCAVRRSTVLREMAVRVSFVASDAARCKVSSDIGTAREVGAIGVTSSEMACLHCRPGD